MFVIATESEVAARQLDITMNFLFLTTCTSMTFFCILGADAVYEPKRIEQHRKQLMRQLQLYVQKSKASDSKRYTELLLYLPLLYGVNGHMVENLLCSEAFSNADMKLVIKKAVSESL